MLPNEVFALECIARYAREGLVVDSSNGQFAHSPYPNGMGDGGYYLTFEDHQHQGLLQSVDVGRKCFWTGHVKAWLNTWPPGCFDLWDIYDEFNKLSEETKEKMSVAHSGEKSYLFGRTGALHHTSKAVIVIKPDGTKLHFGSISEAAREIGMDNSHLCRYIGKQTKWGRYKDWQFFYAE